MLLSDWARNGLTPGEIAKRIGIARPTLYDWVAKSKVISDTLKKNREYSDAKVEGALFKSAVGYYYTKFQPIKVKKEWYDENGKKCSEEKIEVKEYQEFKPADVVAQIFIMKNRRSNEWRDKQVIINAEDEVVTESFADVFKKQLSEAKDEKTEQE